MIKRKSREREQEILAATLRVLRNHGVMGTTTAKFAAEANCSKETLYNWFGNREGLYAALINAQSRIFLGVLERVITKGQTHRERLEYFSGTLLDMLTGEANSLVYQLTVAQFGPEYNLIHTAMRERHAKIKAIGSDLLLAAKSGELLYFEDGNEAYATLYGLIMGDRQVGTFPGFPEMRPNGEQMIGIAEQAVGRMFLIYGQKTTD